MRYYGGGIGHLSNSLPQQTDPLTPDSGEVAVADEEDNAEGLGDTAIDGLVQDVIMRDLGELEVGESDDDGGDDEVGVDPENYDYDEIEDEDEDEDEGSTCGSDEEDSSGYASP